MNRIAAGLGLALAVLAVGCGGSDDDDEEGAEGPDGAALASAFAEAAEAAYAERGGDREQDFAQGIVIDGCLILDDEGALAVARAGTGGEAEEVEISDQSFLTGPPGEEEVTSCSLREPDRNGGDVTGIASVGAGTTLATADQYRERLLREENSSVIEGEAPGLTPEQVVAVDHDDIRTFAWVNEDFAISIHAPVEFLDVEAGFEALPVAVEVVARTLAG